MKCSKCGCTVFHENELDKLECANKADGPMKEKAKAAFEKCGSRGKFHMGGLELEVGENNAPTIKKESAIKARDEFWGKEIEGE